MPRAEQAQAPPAGGRLPAAARERGEPERRRGRAASAPRRPARAGARSRTGRPRPGARFPLVELVVLLALVMLIVGFFVQGTRGVTLIAAGVALGSLAGLELAVREHFAGYRSHTTVLAGAPAVLVLGVGLLPAGGLAADRRSWRSVVFVVGFYLLREAFKRRSGGLGFRSAEEEPAGRREGRGLPSRRPADVNRFGSRPRAGPEPVRLWPWRSAVRRGSRAGAR